MNKKALPLMAVATGLFVFNIDAKALTTREVGNVTDYFNVIEEIHNTENEEYVIKLTDDIIVTDASSIKNNNTIDNGNTVTVLGQGHTYKCTVSNNCRFNVSNGKLHLGASDGTDTLTLEGTGTASDDGESLVTVSNGQAHMYDGVTLTNNISSSQHLAGGGVRVGDNGKFYMHGGTITGNKSGEPGLGGAVMVDGSKSYFEMEDGEISDNYATWYGGGIYQGDGEIKITGGTIKNNSSSIGGAGLASMGGKITISNATFESNEGKTDMGYGYGGAILANYDPEDSDTKLITMSITDTKFKNNTAKYGAAICNYGATGTILTNNIFDSNTASLYGGGLYIIGGDITSTNNKYLNNTATSYGGGIMLRGSLVSNDDKIYENRAQIGGGLFLYEGTANLATSNIYNNKATTQGNDIYITSSISQLSLNAASNMNGYATFDDKKVSLKNWYEDGSTRYSLENPTDVVSTFTAGTSYAVTASGNEASIITFDLGNDETEEQVVELGEKAIRPTNPTKYGKRFVNWYTTNSYTTVFDFNTVINEDISIYAKWEDLVYEITKGNGQNLDKTSDGSFTINADYNVFIDGGKVYIDGTLIDESKYTSKSGSTIISLNEDYLNTLSVGEHTIRVTFTDGGEASGTFNIVEATNSNSNNNSNSNTASNSNSTSNTSNSNQGVKPASETNPKTGDNIITYIVLCVMSITGILVAKLSRKKAK